MDPKKYYLVVEMVDPTPSIHTSWMAIERGINKAFAHTSYWGAQPFTILKAMNEEGQIVYTTVTGG